MDKGQQGLIHVEQTTVQGSLEREPKGLALVPPLCLRLVWLVVLDASPHRTYTLTALNQRPLNEWEPRLVHLSCGACQYAQETCGQDHTSGH